MKKGPKFRMPFKRKFEKRTDYRKRLRLLSSKKLRLVVRKSLKHVKAQIMEFDLKGDKTIVSASTQELKKYGWTNPSNNLTSAYLVGLLIGKRALNKKINSVILDMGLQKSVKGSVNYAVLKGALEAGLSIPHSPEILPTDERISGKHIIQYANKLKKEKSGKYKRQFSSFNPEKIPEMLDKAKKKILKS